MEKPTMLGYIRDQGRALLNTFDNREVYCKPFIKVFGSRDIRKIYILGSGTSYHAALAAKHYFEKYLQTETEVMIPTSFTNYERVNVNGIYRNEQILAIGISQSGTSVSTIHAMRKARESGICTIGVTEAMNSLITEEVDLAVKLTCGKELIPIETRGYTVTVLQAFLTAIELAKAAGKLGGTAYETLMDETRAMLLQYDEMIAVTEHWYERHQDELLGMKHGVIASYGVNTCTALEGVLKMYETFKQPMNGYEIEEMIHGPHMAFGEQEYIFLVASDEAEFERVPLFIRFFRENNITEHIFVFANRRMELGEKDLFYDFKIPVDLSPLVFTLPFQITAAKNCIACGIDTSVRPANRKAFAHIYNEGE